MVLHPNDPEHTPQPLTPTHTLTTTTSPRQAAPTIQRPETGTVDVDRTTGQLSRISRSEHIDTSRLDVGAVIDERYLVEDVLANGSMGWVYRVRHLHLDCIMALKVLDTDQPVLSSHDYRERFRYEAQTVAAINHPNVIRVSDFGFFGPRSIPYMVMEFLEGHDLRHEIDHTSITPTRALDLVEQALSALDAAHHRGIVHKDLKPANLFLAYPNPCLLYTSPSPRERTRTPMPTSA